jgi:hypothetical protein
VKTQVKLLLVLVLSMAAFGVAAEQEVANPYNLLISDGDTRFFQGCTEVRIYTIDPVLGGRLNVVPAVTLTQPENPIRLLLEPGRYELAIWMFYLPFEVPYLYFDVTDGGVNLVDLMTVEFPEGLLTY